jgi:DNA (cytosine-5)-methyltransferase 1
MRKIYYNENNAHSVAWLKELMKKNLIAPGVVDDRSIKEVEPADLRGFTQCHFFAGIGVWSYALRRLAGLPDDTPIWTGSCPCQSFSIAGKQQGYDDPRGRLWKDFFRLISECRPPTIFGEQVAAAIEFGWLDNITKDLGDAGYEVGAAVFPACHVGAPHKRERLYFVADSNGISTSRECRPPGDGILADFWSSSVLERFPDRKRRVVPRTGLLAHGTSDGVALMRGFGNAIVAQQAAEFILAFIEARSEIASPLGLLR